MPRTINEGFRDFITKLTPSESESTAATKHRESIEQCLRNKFELQRFWRIGSFGNGTSISDYSDTDYLASMRDLKANSNRHLQILRIALERRFPRTGVIVRCPAVKVPFGDLAKETIEIVPGDLVETHPDNIYKIPDCSGSWMKTSPDIHNAYVQRIHEENSHKVKPLVRYIKAWKYYMSVPISSFYLEMKVAKYCENRFLSSYPLDIEHFLRHMLDGNLARLQDPSDISGYISPCSSKVYHHVATSRLKIAVAKAEKANQAQKEGDLRSAFRLWNMFYGMRFPKYYK